MNVPAPPPVHILRRLDQHPLPQGSEEIRCFLPVRDEVARLPWFLEYHRRLGVDRFFVIDNGSTDGTCELLLDQPDCHVFQTRNSYVEAHYGASWSNALLDEFGTGRWCLTLDADEQFVYPGSETEDLRSFTRFLEQEGTRGVFAFLLDMYGGVGVADPPKTPWTPFLATCPFFDPDYKWGSRSKLAFWAKRFPPMDMLGGPRLRCFYPEFVAPGAVRTQVQRLQRLGARVLRFPVMRPPRLPKVPFIRWASETRYLNSHTPTELRLSSVSGALLHFKFFADFHARVMAEVNRRRGTATPGTWETEMARYYTRLCAEPSFSLRDHRSVRYESTEQLVQLDLIKDVPTWREKRRAEQQTQMPDQQVAGVAPFRSELAVGSA